MLIGAGSDVTVRTLGPRELKQLAHTPMASLRQNQDPNPSEACTTLYPTQHEPESKPGCLPGPRPQTLC